MRYDILITFLVSVISIIIGALVTRHYSARRRLELVIPSFLDVVALSHVAKDKIQVLYQGMHIKSLWVLRVVIQNRGNFDIEQRMVRAFPRINLGAFARIIDIEPVHLDRESLVELSVEDERYAVLKIDYLQRRRQAAFQIVAHSAGGAVLRPDDIVLENGIIENTTVSLKNLLACGFTGKLERFVNTVLKFNRPLMWAYTILKREKYLEIFHRRKRFPKITR